MTRKRKAQKLPRELFNEINKSFRNNSPKLTELPINLDNLPHADYNRILLAKCLFSSVEVFKVQK